MIISCEHNPGQMGLCRACSEESRKFAEITNVAIRRRRDLHAAADAAERSGLYVEARNLRKKAEQ